MCNISIEHIEDDGVFCRCTNDFIQAWNSARDSLTALVWIFSLTHSESNHPWDIFKGNLLCKSKSFVAQIDPWKTAQISIDFNGKCDAFCGCFDWLGSFWRVKEVQFLKFFLKKRSKKNYNLWTNSIDNLLDFQDLNPWKFRFFYQNHFFLNNSLKKHLTFRGI